MSKESASSSGHMVHVQAREKLHRQHLRVPVTTASFQRQDLFQLRKVGPFSLQALVRPNSSVLPHSHSITHPAGSGCASIMLQGWTDNYPARSQMFEIFQLDLGGQRHRELLQQTLLGT